MKYLLTIAVLVFFPQVVFARAGGGGTHFKNNPPYDCSVIKKPGTPRWVTGIKKEKLNDSTITLTWDDSNRAHKVEVLINGKKKTTEDDSRQRFENLKKGKVYTFKVRGISNCGKSGWSKEYKTLP